MQHLRGRGARRPYDFHTARTLAPTAPSRRGRLGVRVGSARGQPAHPVEHRGVRLGRPEHAEVPGRRHQHVRRSVQRAAAGDVRVEPAEHRHDAAVDRLLGPSMTIVSSSGRKARMLGTRNRRASGEPWNGVQMATRPSRPRGGSAPVVRAHRARASGIGRPRARRGRRRAPRRGRARRRRRRARRDQQLLADQSALAVRHDHATGRRAVAASRARARAVSAVSPMRRRFAPRPCTTLTRWPAALSASPSGRRNVQCS